MYVTKVPIEAATNIRVVHIQNGPYLQEDEGEISKLVTHSGQRDKEGIDSRINQAILIKYAC